VRFSGRTLLSLILSGGGFGEGCGDGPDHDVSCSRGFLQKLSIRCAILSGGITWSRMSRPSLQMGQVCDAGSGTLDQRQMPPAYLGW
jgi:hypothetical protein